MSRVDTQRFLADLDHLRGIGTYKTGVHRPTYGAEDMESRRWLMAEMEALGLEAEMDGIGNILGRHRGSGPRLLVGSHIETQDQAGWLDGALGVTVALALARAGLPVDVGVYADEEGHWGNMLGSRSLVGDLDEDEIDRGPQPGRRARCATPSPRPASPGGRGWRSSPTATAARSRSTSSRGRSSKAAASASES